VATATCLQPAYIIWFGFRPLYVLDHPEKWDYAQRLSGLAFVRLSGAFLLMGLIDYMMYNGWLAYILINAFTVFLLPLMYWVHRKVVAYVPPTV